MKMENYQKLKSLTQRINSVIKELSTIQDNVLDLRDQKVLSKSDCGYVIYKLNNAIMGANSAQNWVFNLQMTEIEDELLKLKQ